MALYQKMLAYGLTAAMGLGTIGCAFTKPVEPGYISGTLQSKKYEHNWVESNKYNFVLSTESGLRMFECSRDGGDPEKMDLLLGQGDIVKLKIPESQSDRKNHFSVCLDDIVEINGKPFSH